MIRPFAVIGITLFLSLLSASMCPLNVVLACGAIALCMFILFLFFRPLRRNARLLAVILTAASACFSYAYVDIMAWRPLLQWDGQTAELVVETLDFIEDDIVRARVVDGALPRGTKLTLWMSGRELYPEPYDRLTGEFILYAPGDTEIDPVTGNIRAGKAFLYAFAAEYGEVGLTSATPPPTLMYRILQLRRYIRITLMSQKGLGSHYGLLGGLSFGFLSDIPDSVNNDFRTAGVSHILSVSGLHTSLVSYALLTILLLFKLPRRGAGVAASCGILLFMALTGFSPSVIRSGIMSILVMLAMTLGRKPDALNSLGLSAIIITAFDPFAIHDIGLLLSFASTFGLLVILSPLNHVTVDRWRSKGGLHLLLSVPAGMINITVAAMIPVLPMMFVVYKTVSLISPLSNILMVNPSLVAMLLAYAGTLLAWLPFAQPISAFVFGIAKWISAYLTFISAALVSIPFASASVDKRYLLVWLFGSLLVISVGCWMRLGMKALRTVALWCVIALMCGMLSDRIIMRGVTSITVAGSGTDTVILLKRGGLTGAVVMGGGDGCEALYYSMRNAGRTKLNFLLMADADGEALYVPQLFADAVYVDTVIANPPIADPPIADPPIADPLVSASLLPAGRKPLSAGQVVIWGAGSVTFWNDSAISRNGEWLVITIADTRLLICPYDGDVLTLNENTRKTNLAIFCGALPENPELLQASGAIAGISLKMLVKTPELLSWQKYPVYNTSKSSVTVQTRGQGDLHFR